MARKPPTMADVAKAAGVSPMTVSRAFKADSAVSADRRALILQVAEELGYVFDSTASNLRAQRSDFVAVTVPSMNNANFADTVKGLTDGLKARGLQILLGTTDYDMAEEERLIGQFLRRRPLAIVVTGGKHSERTRRMLANAALPVVETWDLPEAPIGHVVGFSNADAMRGLVDRFVARGLTRIAFIGGEVGRDTRGADRRLGFVAAMRAHGLPEDRLIAAGPPPVSMREGAVAMAELLDRWPDTQAVICVADLSAFGALMTCQRRGIAVPGQISLAGFGDFEIASVSIPALSTINPFPRLIGERSAELILNLLDGLQTEPARIVIAPELLIRESSV